MGYIEYRLSNRLRKWVVGRRQEKWREKLRADPNLDREDVAALEPYVEYVAHYGSTVDAAGLTVIIVPFVVAMSYLGYLVVESVLRSAFVYSPVLMLGMAAVGTGGLVLLIGGCCYYLWMRLSRYRVASAIKSQFETAPERILVDETVLPVSREDVETVGKTTYEGGFFDSVT